MTANIVELDLNTSTNSSIFRLQYTENDSNMLLTSNLEDFEKNNFIRFYRHEHNHPCSAKDLEGLDHADMMYEKV